jgi:DNA-binding MarR family transcriptional regulator
MAEMMLSHDSLDRFHNACAAADVTPPLLKALMSLSPGTAAPMSVLAKGWRCDASWVTGIVDGLEERGYAQRRTLETDRRVKVVEITEAGEAARAKALDVLFDPPPSINALSAKDQLGLRNLIRKVRAAEPPGFS